MLRLIVRGLTGGLIQVAIFAIALLVPAILVPGGTWRWPRALGFLALYAIIMEAAMIFLAVRAPASLAARLRPADRTQQPKADRTATLLLVASIIAWFAFVPLDVFTLKLLPAP